MNELKQEWQDLKRNSTWSNWLAALGVLLLLTVDWASLIIGG
jgi:hypothetical protein